ncbi:hypothetical protein SPB21_03815 [Leptothoe sp. ISB3NOV94-8A]|uniref:Uncharacterized protein n=1 Tax=Adonisia turfae CCMR0081 TaxID=2292702 RepID=A0A6M0RHS8_9CYAN|nr:hypothetical protein [Adonisia turfae]NEZ55423.1 hypothetical protein [Adonisia turfae CCMR0081]
MTPAELLDKFDQWLTEASEESIRENCRTEGAVFFAFMKKRGVQPSWCAKMIQTATGYNPAWLWKNATPEVVKHSLEAYFYSRNYIELLEEEQKRQLAPDEALKQSIPFWRM